MKKIELFYLPSCPHCVRARKGIEEAYIKNPLLKEVPLKFIDESVEVEYADSKDYYYVPTFYLDGQKTHEGTISEAEVYDILMSAMEA